LNVAIAMIGNPPVVFLDEPSAGMDPHARRFMWKVIAKISTQRKNSAVILTTHSMEEAEALSTKMGIMVDGEFKCFGSKQHIKERKGEDYSVDINILARTNEQIEQSIKDMRVKERLEKEMPVSFKMVTRHTGEDELWINWEACFFVLNRIYEVPELVKELSPHGLGKEHVKSLISHEFIPIQVIVRWISVMVEILKVLKELVDEFHVVELVEHLDTRFTFRVPKGIKTIGFFFGYLESLKDKYMIDDYSAS
jgi:ATP-binding cassette subfamily A (ABC1) protein 3